VKNEGEEVLIFVQFRKNLASFVEVARQISEIVVLLTGTQNCTVVPVRRIPKTTSGKIQRSFLKKSFLNGEFDEAVNYLKENLKHEVLDTNLSPTELNGMLIDFLKAEIARMVAEKTVEINRPLIDFGLTSKHMVMLQAKLSKYCNKQISVEIIFAYPTIEKLSNHLAYNLTQELKESSNSLLTEISEMTDDEIAELL
jgi:aryl carrier-like protein